MRTHCFSTMILSFSRRSWGFCFHGLPFFYFHFYLFIFLLLWGRNISFGIDSAQPAIPLPPPDRHYIANNFSFGHCRVLCFALRQVNREHMVQIILACWYFLAGSYCWPRWIKLKKLFCLLASEIGVCYKGREFTVSRGLKWFGECWGKCGVVLLLKYI